MAGNGGGGQRPPAGAQEEAGTGFEVAGAVMDCGCPESVKVTVSVVGPSLPSSWIFIWCTTSWLSTHTSSAVRVPGGTVADLA